MEYREFVKYLRVARVGVERGLWSEGVAVERVVREAEEVGVGDVGGGEGMGVVVGG